MGHRGGVKQCLMIRRRNAKKRQRRNCLKVCIPFPNKEVALLVMVRTRWARTKVRAQSDDGCRAVCQQWGVQQYNLFCRRGRYRDPQKCGESHSRNDLVERKDGEGGLTW